MSNSLRYRPLVKDISTSLLSEGKTIRIRAHGYSMFPAIKPGIILIIDPVQHGKDPVRGEIVVIKRENGLVVHRVSEIEIRDGIRYYITRGDSNAWPDEPVKKDMIAGRVVRAETTAECREAANIGINVKPSHIINRLKVISILLLKKFNPPDLYRRVRNKIAG